MNWLVEKLAVGAFMSLIYFSWARELCRKLYYVIFRIPHIKQQDKFHPIYMRGDKT